MLDLITEKYEYLSSVSKDKVQLKQVFNQLDIVEGEEIEPMQICDNRTIDMLMTYDFYKNSPQEAFNPIPYVWFEAYNILSKTEPRLM